MRIRIEDDFDNDLDVEYKSIDNDTIVGNGALSKDNIPIIDVKSEDIKEEELVDDQVKNRSIRQEESNKYMERITKIRRYEELVEISNNRDDVLWPWVATLVFNIFGYEVYKSCNLNIDSDRTYILFHPSSEYDFSVVEEMSLQLIIGAQEI